MFKNNEIDYASVNVARMIRTVRGSIKKSIFYLGAKVPYRFTEDLVTMSSSGLVDYMGGRGKKLKKYINLDAKIRICDDILDNKLSAQKPRPIAKMKALIELFVKEVPEARLVGNLFSLELDIINNKCQSEVLKDKIKSLIDIRPCDFFLLAEGITKDFGTVLTESDLGHARQFYFEFQRLRDLLDDVMSIEEDMLKNDYNSIILAKNNNISYHFFDEIIHEKINRLEQLSNKIKKHPHKDLFDYTVTFWRSQYELLFKRLLIDYYINIEEFRKSYFMIKQL